MVNIYVGNLPFNTTDADLSQLFAPFGTIAKVSIITDRETGRSRGFGFVEMPDETQGKAAVEALNGKEFGGRFLTVNEARPRDQRTPGGGGGGGGGGRRSTRESAPRSGGGYSNRLTSASGGPSGSGSTNTSGDAVGGESGGDQDGDSPGNTR